MLSDLTFVEDGNPNMTEAGLINWIKRSLLYNVLSQFTEYQRTCYFTMPEKRFKDALLSSIEKSQTSPTQLYNGSLLIEPRDGEQPPQTMVTFCIFYFLFLFFKKNIAGIQCLVNFATPIRWVQQMKHLKKNSGSSPPSPPPSPSPSIPCSSSSSSSLYGSSATESGPIAKARPCIFKFWARKSV